MAEAYISGIPVFEALVTDAETGMFRISLVDLPAVESNFVAFQNEKKPMMYTIADAPKRLVRGCVMRADFPIYRYDDQMGEYFIIYHAEQIRRMAEKYLVDGSQNNVNLMHVTGSMEGVQMVQFFIKGDGVNVEGFDDVADGSLFAEFHVTNDEIWNAIQEGTFKGFSLEGVFEFKQEQLSKQDKKMSKVKKFLAGLAKVLQELGAVTTNKGILVWEGDEDLEAGMAVSIQEADGATTPAEDGEYETEDGKVIVVAEGKVAEIKDKEAEVAPEAEPEAKVEPTVEAEGEEAPATEEAPAEEDSEEVKALKERIAELEAENEALKAQIAEKEAVVEEMKAQSMAKPAHEEVEASVKFSAPKGKEKLARFLNAK